MLTPNRPLKCTSVSHYTHARVRPSSQCLLPPDSTYIDERYHTLRNKDSAHQPTIAKAQDPRESGGEAAGALKVSGTPSAHPKGEQQALPGSQNWWCMQ